MKKLSDKKLWIFTEATKKYKKHQASETVDESRMYFNEFSGMNEVIIMLGWGDEFGEWYLNNHSKVTI